MSASVHCGVYCFGDHPKKVWNNMESPSAFLDIDRITIGELAREAGVTLLVLRCYQSKGLLTPQRKGHVRVFTAQDRDSLTVILQGKRLGFTLGEIREMLAARIRGSDKALPISRRKCVELIKHLEHQRRDVEVALAELRQIYTGMYITSDISRAIGAPVSETA
jgi:DNA-binding transcriptional MerR regulator